MTDYWIIGILAVLAAVAGRAVYKRLRGESSCCGGSTYRAKPKRLGKIIWKHTFRVEGMHCRNCENRVMEALQALEGVSAAVHLKRGTVTVSAEKEQDPEALCAVIEKAGYTVRNAD